MFQSTDENQPQFNKKHPQMGRGSEFRIADDADAPEGNEENNKDQQKDPPSPFAGAMLFSFTEFSQLCGKLSVEFRIDLSPTDSGIKESTGFLSKLIFVKPGIPRCRIISKQIHQKKSSLARALVSAEAVKGILVV